MPENALKTLDVLHLTGGFSEIITQLDGVLSLCFEHFNDQ
jgi:hypothetical protein